VVFFLLFSNFYFFTYVRGGKSANSVEKQVESREKIQ
jgi:hypothetical protein